MRLQTVGLSLVLVAQVLPVAGQDPLVIKFAKTEIEDAREGHVQLSWDDVLTADLPQREAALARDARYELTDDVGRVVYSGVLPTAFVSGLNEGRHSFSIRGVDADGTVIAVGASPVVVRVRHWAMWQAWLLFSIGALVMTALVAVILVGIRNERGSS